MTLSWPEPLPAHGPVVLRPYRDSDLSLVAELAADPYIPLISTVPQPFTDEAGLAFIARQHSRLTSGTGWSFVVADADDDRAVGSAGLWVRELQAGRATAGYCVGPSARGTGVATAALTALTAFAWTVPGLYRVELHIEGWNTASLHVAARVGYLREGVLRSHQEIGGTRRDMVLCAAVRPPLPAEPVTAEPLTTEPLTAEPAAAQREAPDVPPPEVASPAHVSGTVAG